MYTIPKQLLKFCGQEDLLTMDVASWLSDQGLLFTHIPNEGKRTFTQSAKIRLLGVLAGLPDIAIFEPNKYYSGLFIELKVIYPSGKKNSLSRSQKDVLEKLNLRGYKGVVCYSLNEVKKVVTDYLKDRKKE